MPEIPYAEFEQRRLNAEIARQLDRHTRWQPVLETVKQVQVETARQNLCPKVGPMETKTP